MLHRTAALLLLTLLAATPARAADHPVRGSVLDLSEQRFGFLAVDPSIALQDPRDGATLFLHASNAPGQCHAEIALDPDRWFPIHPHGFVYFDLFGRSGPVRLALLAPGLIWMVGFGSSPCSLAQAQTLPVGVELRFDGGDRYCAAFGGSLDANQAGRFRAFGAAAPAACLDADVTLVNLNLLHGLFCEPEQCRLADRVDLFFEWLVDAGCPDVVTLQEIISSPFFESSVELLEARLPDVCPFPYEAAFEAFSGIDDQMILSRHPVLAEEVQGLHGGFRSVSHVRVDHPAGAVDVFSTHLASSSDAGPSPCETLGPCPAECLAAGATTVRQCQAVQTAAFAESRHTGEAPAFVTGDLNAQPGSFTYEQFAGRGWPDTHLLGGNPECDPLSGSQCTSGRSSSTAALEDPDAQVGVRIDYIFLIPPGAGSRCAAEVDTAEDLDADGTATRIFSDLPNPFAACGPAPAPICWPSDHEGNELDLNCF